MKEVLTAINSLRSDMDAKFAAIDTKFDGLSMRIKTLYWVVGVCVVPILLYIFKSFI